MRLIDADKLIKSLKDFADDEGSKNLYGKKLDLILEDCIIEVEKQPTAYNVDKVVEQLRDRSTLSRPVGWSKSYEIITLDEAIEIVKAGGANEKEN